MGHSKPQLKSKIVRERASQTFVNTAHASSIGIDVHLAVLVCAYQHHVGQEIATEICEFGTSASQLKAFAQWCRDRNPEVIMMESTGVLWLSPYEALEAQGFTSQQLALVNARDVKAAMGRKTDREDAQRLATFARLGNFRRSFVPPKIFREMRLISRSLQRERAQIAQRSNRFQKTLNFIGCRASTVFSDVVHGKAARIILEAYIYGAEDLEEIIAKNCRRLRATPEEIIDALAFAASPHMINSLRDDLATIDYLRRRCRRLEDELREMQKPYESHITLLCQLPGVKETSARIIFSELCDDLKGYFPNVEQFASWLGICPGNHISAGKSYSNKTPKGNKHLRRALTECAQSIGQMKKGPLWEFFTSVKLRRGKKRAVVAVAHKLARIIYSCLTTGECYQARSTTVLQDTCGKRLKAAQKLHSTYVDKPALVVPPVAKRDFKGASVTVLSG